MKNYLLGVGFLLLAFYLLWQQGTQQLDRTEPSPAQPSYAVSTSKDSNLSLEPSKMDDLAEEKAFHRALSSDAPLSLQEEVLTDGLSTNLSSLTFSNHTGSIRSIHLHQSSRLNKAFAASHPNEPLLGISFEDDQGRLIREALPKTRDFKLIENSPKRVVYRSVSSGDLQIDRIYERSEEDGYVLRHSTIFTSLRNSPIAIERVRMSLGSSFQIPRMYNPFDQASTYLSVGYFNDGAPLAEGCSCATCSGRIDGEREEFFHLNELGPSGRIEPRRLSKAKWACVNNQFFVNLLRPETEIADLRVW